MTVALLISIDRVIEIGYVTNCTLHDTQDWQIWSGSGLVRLLSHPNNFMWVKFLENVRLGHTFFIETISFILAKQA